MFFRSSCAKLNVALGLMAYLFGHCNAAHQMPCSIGPCGPGEFLDPEDNCRSCPPDTYMSAEQHGCRDCKGCSTPNQHNHEIVLQKCTAVNDTVIACHAGYFWTSLGGHENECHKCKNCPFGTITISKCGLFSDTVCTVVTTSDSLLKPEGQTLQLQSPPFYVMSLVVVFGTTFFVFLSYLRFRATVSVSVTLVRK